MKQETTDLESLIEEIKKANPYGSIVITIDLTDNEITSEFYDRILDPDSDEFEDTLVECAFEPTVHEAIKAVWQKIRG
ncbi:MAG: hypothetical protein GY938_16755 [Ketobacter sp.]|nr:hypothetical protein [Ketobacter sp.]